LGGEQIDKTDERVTRLKEWVDAQYESGRVTTLASGELMAAARELEIK
jgi:hypothetical protein